MKINVNHGQALFDTVQRQQEADFLGADEGFQGMLLHILTLMSVNSANMEQDGSADETMDLQTDLNPASLKQGSGFHTLGEEGISAHRKPLAAPQESSGANTLAAPQESSKTNTLAVPRELSDIHSLISPKESSNPFQEHPERQREIQGHGIKQDVLVAEILKQHRSDPKDPPDFSSPMEKLMESIETIHKVQEGEERAETFKNSKLPSPSFKEGHPDQEIHLSSKPTLPQKMEGREAKEPQEQHKMQPKDGMDHLAGQPTILSPEGLRMIKSPPQNIKIQNFQEVAGRMVEEVKVLQEGEQSILKVKLKPEGLGEMEIRLEMKSGELTGKFLVDNMAAKGALDKQIEQLKMQLKDQNITLKEMDVDLQNQHQDHSRERGYGQHQQQKEHSIFLNPLGDYTGEKEEMEMEGNPHRKIQSPPYSSRTYSSALNLLA